MIRESHAPHFSIADEFDEFYHRRGYIIIRDLFREAEIEEIYRDVLEIFSNRFGGHNPEESIIKPYSSQKNEWQACAKQMQYSLPQLHIGSKPEITGVLRKLGLRSPTAWVLPEVRIDMPRDQQYMQPWHQDWRSGQGSFNSVTIWVPLHDVSKDRGAINVIPGSHLWGYLDVDVIQNPVRYIMRSPPQNIGASVTAELKRGECILFSQLTVHASGENVSSMPRLTCQFRFADRLESNFVENNYRIPDTTELVWERTPTAADMMRIHDVGTFSMHRSGKRDI